MHTIKYAYMHFTDIDVVTEILQEMQIYKKKMAENSYTEREKQQVKCAEYITTERGNLGVLLWY